MTNKGLSPGFASGLYRHVPRPLRDLFSLKPDSPAFLHLDALRFLASAGIVTFHYREWIDWGPSAGRLPELIGFPLFVDVFFVISGMVIYSVYQGRMADAGDYRDFLGKRAARLIPLHWLTFLFFCVIGVISQRFGNDSAMPDWSCAAPTVVMIHALGVCGRLSFNTPSWSISAEMAVYLAFPWLLALVRRPRLGWVVLAGILVGLTAGSAVFSPHRHWYERTFDFGVVRAVPGFLFGALVASRKDLLKAIPAPGLLMGLSLLAFVVLRMSEAPGLLRLGCAYLIPVLGLAADQRSRPGRVVRGLAPLGQLTYSIYLLHLPVAWLFVQVLARRLQLHGLSQNLAVIATGALLTPLAAILSLKLIETPARRWITRRLKPLGAPAARPVKDIATARDFAP